MSSSSSTKNAQSNNANADDGSTTLATRTRDLLHSLPEGIDPRGIVLLLSAIDGTAAMLKFAREHMDFSFQRVGLDQSDIHQEMASTISRVHAMATNAERKAFIDAISLPMVDVVVEEIQKDMSVLSSSLDSVAAASAQRLERPDEINAPAGGGGVVIEDQDDTSNELHGSRSRRQRQLAPWASRGVRQ